VEDVEYEKLDRPMRYSEHFRIEEPVSAADLAELRAYPDSGRDISLMMGGGAAFRRRVADKDSVLESSDLPSHLTLIPYARWNPKKRTSKKKPSRRRGARRNPDDVVTFAHYMGTQDWAKTGRVTAEEKLAFLADLVGHGDYEATPREWREVRSIIRKQDAPGFHLMSNAEWEAFQGAHGNPGRTCPKCKARAGNPCKTASGKKAAKPHAARRKNAPTKNGPETLIMKPAYGRDYKSQAEVVEDWNDGKDFQIQDISSRYSGKYASIRDSDFMIQDGLKNVKIRYNRAADWVFIDLKSGKAEGSEGDYEDNPKKKRAKKKASKKRTTRKKKEEEPTIGKPTKGKPIMVGVPGRADYNIRVSYGGKQKGENVYYSHILDASGSVLDGEKKGRMGPYADPDDAARMGQIIASAVSGAGAAMEAAENPARARKLRSDARRAFAKANPGGLLASTIAGKGTLIGDVMGGAGLTDPTEGVSADPEPDFAKFAGLPQQDPGAAFRLGYYYGIIRGFDYCKWCVSPLHAWERWKFQRLFRQKLIDASNDLAKSALAGKVARTGRAT
jgi:hypothetical protein